MRGSLEKVEFQTGYSGMGTPGKDVSLGHDDGTQGEALPGAVY